MALPVARGELIDAGACADPSGEPSRSSFTPDAAAELLARTLLDLSWNREAAMSRLRLSGADELTELAAVVTGAARLLGEWWVADTCTFADVTLGLHRLTLLLFDIEAVPIPGRARLHGGTVLLAPTAGDQHGFGLAVVAMALRHAGWDVSVELVCDEDRLLRRAAARRFDCIGLSVGHDRAVAPTRRLIERLRGVTRATRPAVAVGGPMLMRRPDLAALVGADFVAESGFALAERLASVRAA